MFTASSTPGVTELRLPLDYRVLADHPHLLLRGIDEQLQAAFHAILKALESEHDIVVHTAFIGGGRLLGLWDASSDFDIYGVFAARHRESRALARTCKFPSELKDTIRTKCALPTALVEVRLWSIEKVAQLICSNNGDALNWLRAPDVIVSHGCALLNRNLGHTPDWRHELLSRLCALPPPPGAPGISRALALLMQRAYGNLLDQLESGCLCACLSASGACGSAALRCSCSLSDSAQSASSRARRDCSVASPSPVLTDEARAVAATVPRHGPLKTAAGRSHRAFASTALPLKRWMYACLSALFLECALKQQTERCTCVPSGLPAAESTASVAPSVVEVSLCSASTDVPCGAETSRPNISTAASAKPTLHFEIAALSLSPLPPVAFDDLFASAMSLEILGPFLASQLQLLSEMRRACSDPDVKGARFCTSKPLSSWLDDVRVRAASHFSSAKVHVQCRMASFEEHEAIFRDAIEVAVFRVLRECGVWCDL